MTRNNKNNKAKKNSKRKTNCWDFLNNVVDKLFYLLKLEKIFAASIFTFLLVTIILTIRVPSKDMSGFIYFGCKSFIALIKTGYAYNITITILFIISLIGNVVIHKVHGEEIKRISENRKSIIHGYDVDDLRPLKSHNSSDRINVIKKSKEILR